MALSLVDPLDGAAVWREHVRHEGAHALGAILLGFDFDDVYMDPYHDFGSWGALQGLRRDPLTSKVRASDDPMADLAEFERLEYLDHNDRSVVARLGVMTTLAQSWSGGGARGDRENVESNRPADYSPGAWDLLVEHAALRLLRREDFRFKHAAVVRTLEREGRLTYEQVAELGSGSQSEPTRARRRSSLRNEASVHRVGLLASEPGYGLVMSNPRSQRECAIDGYLVAAPVKSF